jgi:sulfatase modifying factor 1
MLCIKRVFEGNRGSWLWSGLVMATAASALISGCGSKRLPGLTSGGTSSTTSTSTAGGQGGNGEGGLGGGTTTGSGASTGTGGGSGGEGGMAPSGPIGELGGPCSPKGALACAGHAQPDKLVCGPGSIWASNGTCAQSTLCDTQAGEKQGTCQPVVPACAGKSPGAVVCDGLTRLLCGPDLVTSEQIEVCPTACVAGFCAACWPGDIQCAGNTPQTCDAAGAWKDDPTCVGQTCVNGNCVGNCAPQEKACVGNQPQSCDPTGEWQVEPACSVGTPICAEGACVGPSCVNLPETCGAGGNESCCAGAVAAGGMFNRSNFAAYPATVGDFWLDRFEVTVGRFRKFVEAYPGNKPAPGAGAHPAIAGSGWDASWDAKLPVDQAALRDAVKCEIQYETWTDAPGAHELLPMNCLSWHVAFAFCAWDGQRLPTEAEWNYAAAGGAEQRLYPWGNTMPDAAHAVYDCTGDGSPAAECAFTDILEVGKKPLGKGKWGQMDMSGSVWEWNMDLYQDPYALPCVDCANLVDPAAIHRTIRGGAFPHQALGLLTENRFHADPDIPNNAIGLRCAKTP